MADFLTNLIVYGLAFLGVLVAVVSLIAAAILSLQERYGSLTTGHSLDRTLSATDRLHAEAQRAIRDLENLNTERGR